MDEEKVGPIRMLPGPGKGKYPHSSNRSMDDIISQWIVYGKSREPKDYFIFGERAIMGKHLERLIESGHVAQDGDRFYAL